ncbi:unnamed protein product [Moneuplotes crassus]|uniref:RING-type domain-containing protein n=1 Tax=Euplotes crassus TaxID=5936 RepID=A0AAD1XRL6_EUPCR|nr:unnamed protein product [Moneuplotes crassus]
MNEDSENLINDDRLAREPMLRRRPSSVNYNQHAAEQERIRANNIIKQGRQTSSRLICSLIFMLICVFASSLDNCGPNIKGLLWLAIEIKAGLAVYYYAMIYCLSKRGFSSIFYHVLDIIIFIGLLVFHYYVISLYYRGSNTCRDDWNWLWFGHFLLLIEAFCSICACCCISCLVTVIIGLLCCTSVAERQKRRANIAISDLLLNAAQFKFNPEDYRSTKECTICLEGFKEGDNIINLPCHSTHIFHAQCIADWVRINNNCPLCKTPITQEDINAIELPESNL